MAYFKDIVVAALLAVSAITNLSEVNGNPYVISDNRVRNLDVTPVLGRGYSIMTNSFQSTCLEVKETTIPSFNYDYSFYDFTGSSDSQTDLATKLSGSYAYDDIAADFAETYDETSSSSSNTHYIIASMRIERYYASVKEEASAITAPAMTLLTNQDYIGFFKACGPNFVRSIRRVQEVTTKFKFTSSSVETAGKFAASLQQTGSSGSSDGTTDTETNFKSISSSMEIKIQGYGLGLTLDGSETLMATSLGQYNGVMNFAYNLMTKNPHAAHVGMVYGIEVVPWVENVLFQVAAQVTDTVIEIPLARSLIPRAYNRTNKDDLYFDKTDPFARIDFRCKNPGSVIDKYGYCCESQAMYDYETSTYNDDDLNERTCRPIRQLDGVLIKENLAGNGEFVARLDATLRYKTNGLSNLQRCISSIRGYPEAADHHYLKPNAGVVEGIKLTVYDMKNALDPFNDFSLVKHMGRELDEFIDMFYAPCLAALFGSNVGTSSSTDPSYFMAYPWHSHKECSYMSCTADGMRWDRDNGGCVPGLTSGPNTGSYVEGSDSTSKCSFDTESGSEEQVCKYSSVDQNAYQDKIKACWSSGGAGGAPAAYLMNYCMPRVSSSFMDLDVFEDYKGEGCNDPQRRKLGEMDPAPVKRERKLSVTEMHNKKKAENIAKMKRGY